jgi:hypothetical protein
LLDRTGRILQPRMPTPLQRAWCSGELRLHQERGAQAACLHKPAASRRSEPTLPIPRPDSVRNSFGYPISGGKGEQFNCSLDSTPPNKLRNRRNKPEEI